MGGRPDGVALQTMAVEELGGGRTRLVAQSLVESFASRDGWLRSGMETGVDQGYAALDRLLADGEVARERGGGAPPRHGGRGASPPRRRR